jgi:hypothetical protein
LLPPDAGGRADRCGTHFSVGVVQDLHRKAAPINPSLGFAMGWSVMPRDGVESHEHVGSYGAAFA